MAAISFQSSHLRHRTLALLSTISLVLAAAMAAVPSVARAAAPACSVSWTGAAHDNLWGDVGNWSTGSVPGATSDVCITTGNLDFVSAIGAQSVRSVRVGQSDTLILGASNAIDNMTVATLLANSGVVELDHGTLTAGQIDNPGAIESVQGGRITSPAFSSSGSVAVLDGKLTLADPPQNLSAGRLAGGQWLVLNFGVLALPGSITTLDASVGVGGGPIVDSTTGSNALAGLTTIERGAQLSADGPVTLTIAGSLTTQGAVIVGGYASPGSLSVGGTYTQQSGGSTMLTDGTLTAKQVDIGSASNLEILAATVAGNLQNAGFVSGSSGGKVAGNYTQTSTGTLQVAFSSAPFPISGAATLTGTLQVYTLFPPTPGSRSTVLTFASLAGSFTSTPVGFRTILFSTHVDVVAEPQITVTPDAVAPGQSVTVSGGDFAENDSVSIYLGSGIPLATVTAARNGSFQTTVTIPTDTATGTQTVFATGTSRRTAKVSLQIS